MGQSARTDAPAANNKGVRRVFANVGLLLGGKAGAGIVSLAYLVIVARTLGATDYGVLILIHAYVTLIGGVVAFSGTYGFVRFGSIALEQNNHERVLALGRLLTLIEGGFGIVAIFIAAALAPIIAPHMEWPQDAVRFATVYSLAILANVRATPLGVLQMAGRFDLIALHHLVSPVVRLIGSILVWGFGGGLIGFLAVWLAAAVAEWAAMWFLGLWVLGRMDLDAPLRGTVRGVFQKNPGLKSFLVTTNADITLRELAPRLVPLAIGWILNPAAAGVFSLAQRASVILEQPATLLGQASYSVLARLAASGDLKHLSATVWRSSAAALSLSIPVVILLAFAGTPLLHLLGGKSFNGGSGVLLLLAIARAFAIAAPPISSALIAIGRPDRSIYVNLTSNLFLLPLLPFLLITLGLDGAGWHAVFQAGFSTIALAWFFRSASRQS
ncbi:MAG TPA: lipopolysaccharide biosynthesis protein [Sphingomicrobium sp.]|nr:lipopolysaccharide biosynthesis protein [Sphingomicrobium sp.]